MKVFSGLMGDSHNTTTQPHKYIGKELDRAHGLDWYDHGARHYPRDGTMERSGCLGGEILRMVAR